MTNSELIVLYALGVYLAVLLVIAIVMLVLMLRLYRKLAADDAALTRDDYALLKREAARVWRKWMDELREEARR